MAKGIPGILYVTAIAGEAEQNIAFYANLLGLRLTNVADRNSVWEGSDVLADAAIHVCKRY